MRRIPSGYLRVFKDFPGFSGFLQDCFMLDYQDALRIFCGIFRIWKSLTTLPEFLQNICGIFGMLSGFLQDFQDSFRILMLMDSQLWIRIRQLQPKVVGWGRKKILQGFFPTRSRNSRRIHEMIGKRNWTLSSSSRPLLILIPIQPES